MDSLLYRIEHQSAVTSNVDKLYASTNVSIHSTESIPQMGLTVLRLLHHHPVSVGNAVKWCSVTVIREHLAPLHVQNACNVMQVCACVCVCVRACVCVCVCVSCAQCTSAGMHVY